VSGSLITQNGRSVSLLGSSSVFRMGESRNFPMGVCSKFQPAQTVPFGAGPTTFSPFLSPKNPTNGWLWGIGPVIQVPTISDKSLGSNVWGGGPTGVLVYMEGPWVTGILANNVWSFGGTPSPGGTRYNTFLTQPFVNYNFGEGWYVGKLSYHHGGLADI
jgi:hypothetical protein